MMRGKIISPYCIKCRTNMNTKKKNKKYKKEHLCLDCGRKVKVSKCPHCKKIIKYFVRCNICLTKIYERKIRGDKNGI